MARTVRDASLESRAARGRLKARGKPYWRSLEEGLHLGYRKSQARGGRARGGKWVVRHYIGNQSYIVETIAEADDFSDADGTEILSFTQAQAAARERRRRRGQDAGTKAGPLTVAAAMASYLEYLETNRKTGQTAAYRVNAFILPKLGDIEVEDLTTDRLRRWHADLAKQPPRLRTKTGEKQQHGELADDDEAIRRRRTTANRTMTVLKAALNRAWRDGKTSSDAAWRRVEPFKGVNTARIRYLSVPEAKRLINAAAEPFRKLIQAALFTGARYGELGRLTVADFTAHSGTVAIRQSKTGKPRHVVLNEEGAAFFQQLCAGRAGSEIMLPRPDGDPWGTAHQGRPMMDASTQAKLSPPISFHGLRHTYASLSVMAGVPLLVVAKNLGHRDTRMVEHHYGHLAQSYVADAIRAGAPRFGFKADEKVKKFPG